MTALLRAGALLLALQAGVASPQPPQHDAMQGNVQRGNKQDSAPRNNHPDTARAMSVVHSAPAVKLEGGANGKTDQGDGKSDKAGVIPRDWPNITIAFFTVVLAAVGIWQARIARDSAQQELRAYVAVEGRKVRPPIVTGTGRFEFHLQMENVGKTPANTVTQWAWAGVRPRNLPKGTVFPEPPEGIFDSNVVLGRGQKKRFSTRTDPIADPEQIAALAEHTAAIYVFARVSYRDVFGKPHQTDLCQRLTTQDGRNYGVDVGSYNKAT